VLALARRGAARVITFHAGDTQDARDGVARFAEGQALLRLDGHEQALFTRADVRLPGAHLATDLLAAAAAARLMGAPATAVRQAVAAFEGLENVLERVAVLDGVSYFNDTKATNVDAARHSLLAFDGPLHVIMGGRYKGGDFASLAEVMRGRVHTLLTIGEARERLAAALAATVPIVACASLTEAVQQAQARARAGDTVLLAPACASFDMFRDYAARGQAFRDAVAALPAAQMTKP
jgi:UDP-N-acetylmuramoylalanine--D-glutamate ligase